MLEVVRVCLHAAPVLSALGFDLASFSRETASVLTGREVRAPDTGVAGLPTPARRIQEKDPPGRTAVEPRRPIRLPSWLKALVNSGLEASGPLQNPDSTSEPSEIQPGSITGPPAVGSDPKIIALFSLTYQSVERVKMQIPNLSGPTPLAFLSPGGEAPTNQCSTLQAPWRP